MDNEIRDKKENLIGVNSVKEPLTGISPLSPLFAISLHFRMICFFFFFFSFHNTKIHQQRCTEQFKRDEITLTELAVTH